MASEFRDEQPGFRVVMERTLEQVGLESLFGKENEILNIISLNGNLSIDGTGTCTIVVNNSEARAMRRINNLSGTFNAERVSEYMKILKNCASGAYPINFTNKYLADVMRGSHNRFTPTGAVSSIDDYASILQKELIERKWVPVFDLMAKVWIFFRRFDGTWYQGWTGIVSEINIEDLAQEQQTITIRCTSLWRIIALSQWIIQPGLTPSSDLQTETERRQRERTDYSVWTNNLAKQQPINVVKNILQDINITYSRQVDGILEGWWNVDPNDGLSKAPYIKGWTNENGELSIQCVGDPYPKERFLFIDKNITSRSSVLNIVQDNWGLYRNQVDTPATIFRNMVALTGYDMYLDEIGNFIFQIPQYDNIPAPIKNTGNKDHLGLKYHGPEYINGGFGVSSFSYRNAEGPLITYAEAPSEGAGYLPGLLAGTQNSPLEPAFTGVWRDSLENEERFLVRRRRLLSVPGITDKEILATYAKMKAHEINAEAVTGSVTMPGRPDFQIGRTMLFLEYNLLSYITRKSFKYTFGGQVDFTYDWGWGHHPLEEVGVPWIELDQKRSNTRV